MPDTTTIPLRNAATSLSTETSTAPTAAALAVADINQDGGGNTNNKPTPSSLPSMMLANDEFTSPVTTTTAKRRRRLPRHREHTKQLVQQLKVVMDTQQALTLLQLPIYHPQAQAQKQRQQQRQQQQEAPLSESTTSSTTSNTLPPPSLNTVEDADNSNDNYKVDVDDNDDDNDNDDDQVFVDALHLCGKAKRSDVALAIYPDLCSTEACRQMAIYACGKSSTASANTDNTSESLPMGTHEQQVLHLLSLRPNNNNSYNTASKEGPSTTTAAAASIASYNTALTVLHWKRAYQLLIHNMTKLPPSSRLPTYHEHEQHVDHHEQDDPSRPTTTATPSPYSVLHVLSCNIVLYLMAKAHRGEEALQLWKLMTTVASTTPQAAKDTVTATTTSTTILLSQPQHEQQQQQQRHIFPLPDRTSWHHVMDACLGSFQYQHRKLQKSKRSTFAVVTSDASISNGSHSQAPLQPQREQQHQAKQQQQLLLLREQARAVYYDLFLPHVMAHDDVVTPSEGDDHTSTRAGSTGAIDYHDHGSNPNYKNSHCNICFVPNHRTYELLARAYSKMGDWEMVKTIEEHRKQHHHQQQQQEQMASSTRPAKPPNRQQQQQQQPEESISQEHKPSIILKEEPLISTPSACNTNSNEVACISISAAAKSQQPTPMPLTLPTTVTKNSNADLEQQYYYFQHWTGMTKVGRGKAAYWILGTYHFSLKEDVDEQQPVSTLLLRIALQPHRNPSKNGIKLLFLTPDEEQAKNDAKDRLQQHPLQAGFSSPTTLPTNTNNRKMWKKLGYVLMINAKNHCEHRDNDVTATPTISTTECTGIRTCKPTSTLLGLFIDPTYRKIGLSKTFLAIWLHCCRLAQLQPQTGLIRKPLLSLVLEHTFGFVPMTTTTMTPSTISTAVSNNSQESDDSSSPMLSAEVVPQGVQVEIFVPPANLDSDTTDGNGDWASLVTSGESIHDGSLSALKLHLYSPIGKSLKGSFSPWDLTREGIVIHSNPPPAGSRGRRVIHLMCNFVSSLSDARLEGKIKGILSGRSAKPTMSNSNSSSHHNDDQNKLSSNLMLVLPSTELQNIFLGK